MNTAKYENLTPYLIISAELSKEELNRRVEITIDLID